MLAESVAELSHQALRAEQPDALLRESLQMAIEVIGADYGTAVRRLPHGQLRVAHELGPQPLPPGFLLPIASERSYVLRVIETGQPFASHDLRSDPRIAPPGPLLDRGVISGLAVPVRGGDSVMGALALHSRHHRRFSRDDVATANALASVVATAWEQAAHREVLQHQALHDALTELPNRTLFLDRLDQLLSVRPSRSPADGGGMAVMLVDLDDFKSVNDSFGHATGDHLLRVAAHRLRAVLRTHDTIARLGGDEFAVLCESVPDRATAVDLAHRMKEACDRPIELAGSTVAVRASVGVAWRDMSAPPAEGAALLAESDAALYHAKRLGGRQVQVFDEGLSYAARHRRELEADLRLALDRDELRLHYQPVRRAGDLSVVGVEALVRWQHPLKGLLMPGEFIPVAEQTGLLGPLGDWVLETACRQAATWQQEVDHAADLWVAVNVSPQQLHDPRLPATVAAAQRRSGLREGTLVLELTESALMPDEPSQREALRGLRETGAQLFLDDVGTGYSSLTHLTRLPIQAVKIDRSFVAGLPGSRRDTAVVSALVSLCRDLGLGVIAEGVETPEQLTALRSLSDPLVQGFLTDLPCSDPDLDPKG
jgi:diguanylate cyclase (GGDEF)-like protein